MIILLDTNIWEKLAESLIRGLPQIGTLIIEKHLIDDGALHWVKEMGGKKLLGRAELNHPIASSIDEVSEGYLNLAGFPSRHSVKRTFMMFSREVKAITVCEMKIVEIEKYWCPDCLSVNLIFLGKNIHLDQLPFKCFDCGTEFYTRDLDEGSRRIKNARLKERYCKEGIKMIPSDQQAVLAAVGEQWREI